MLIEDLVDFFFGLFTTLFSDIYVPKFEYFDYIYDFVSMIIVNGSTAANIFLPFEYILILSTLTIDAELVVFFYGLAMWIVKKIPVLGIS